MNSAPDVRAWERVTRGSRGPMIVEFVGLPGAGKSTVADSVLRELASGGYVCVGRRRPPRGLLQRLGSRLRAAAFHLRHLEGAAAAISYSLTARPVRPSRLGYALKVWQWAHQLRPVGAAPYDLVVLDQGVIQDTWSLLVGATRWNHAVVERLLRHTLATIAPRLGLVYFDVSLDAAMDRIRRRPRTTSRFDRMSAAEAKRLLLAHQADLERLFAYSVRCTGRPSLRVDGTRSVLENARAIRGFVEVLVGGAGTVSATVSSASSESRHA